MASVTAGTNVNYAWAFGDGTFGSGAVVMHNYPDVGMDTAVVTASNSVGDAVAETQVTIENDAWTIYMPAVLNAGASSQQTAAMPLASIFIGSLPLSIIISRRIRQTRRGLNLAKSKLVKSLKPSPVCGKFRQSQ